MAMNIVMENVQVQVGDLPGVPGGKMLQFRDQQSGVVVSIPLMAEAARIVASGLTSGLIVTDKLPPNGKVN